MKKRKEGREKEEGKPPTTFALDIRTKTWPRIKGVKDELWVPSVSQKTEKQREPLLESRDGQESFWRR